MVHINCFEWDSEERFESMLEKLGNVEPTAQLNQFGRVEQKSLIPNVVDDEVACQ